MSDFADWPVNPVDLVAIGVTLLSALLAFVRGLIKEVLSVGAWVGAALAAIFGLQYLEPYALQYIGVPLIATLVTGGTIFVVALVVLSLVSYAITNTIKGSMLSGLDRSLGFVFGIMRGVALMCLAFLALDLAVPPNERPEIIQAARSYPVIEYGADLLRQLVPENMRAEGAAKIDAVKRKAQETMQTQPQFKDLVSPPVRAAPDPEAGAQREPGYDPKQRGEMDRLIENSQ